MEELPLLERLERTCYAHNWLDEFQGTLKELLPCNLQKLVPKELANFTVQPHANVRNGMVSEDGPDLQGDLTNEQFPFVQLVIAIYLLAPRPTGRLAGMHAQTWQWTTVLQTPATACHALEVGSRHVGASSS